MLNQSAPTAYNLKHSQGKKTGRSEADVQLDRHQLARLGEPVREPLRDQVHSSPGVLGERKDDHQDKNKERVAVEGMSHTARRAPRERECLLEKDAKAHRRYRAELADDEHALKAQAAVLRHSTTVTFRAHRRESWRKNTSSVSPADVPSDPIDSFADDEVPKTSGNSRRLPAVEKHENFAAASVDPASQPRTCRNRVAQ